jgi:hypothetical protein
MIKAVVNDQSVFESPLPAFSVAETINKKQRKHYLGFWLLGVIIAVAFGLVDLAMVAVPAMAISVSQLLAVAISFLLIAGGLLVTVWRLEN